jgi:hypothetical protein
LEDFSANFLANFRRFSSGVFLRGSFLMTTKQFRLYLCIAIVGFSAARASAVVLFSDNFNTNTSANWNVNKAPTATDVRKQTAQFAFDYSSFGIPAPPGSSDTLGLRLRANLPIDTTTGAEITTRPAGTTSGLSVSPTGQSFTGNYYLSFDTWANFFGSPNVSGLADNANSEGGTYNIMTVVGTSGTNPAVVGNTSLVTNGVMDGIGLATTPDGGITSDFRIYPANGTIVPGTNAAYKAGSNGNTAALYATTFPAQTAPTVQQALSTAEYGSDPANTQLGSTQPGSFGFAWHHVVISNADSHVIWTVDGVVLVDADITGIVLGGNNIAFGVSDVNTTTARHPSLGFLIVDNVVVTDTAPPALFGDFNRNNTVDASDYVVYRKNDATSNTLPNDNGLGVPIGAGHYSLWRSHFGNTPTSGSGSGDLLGANIPEPSSMLLLIISAGCCCWSVRKRFVRSYV